MTPEIMQILGQLYLQEVQSWQALLNDNPNDHASLNHRLHTSLLAIKILRRLLISGYEFPHRESEVHHFWELTSSQVGSCIHIISNSPALPVELMQLVEKHLLQLSKLHLEMSKTHPASFVILPNSINLVRSYWSLVKQYGETFGSRTASTHTAAALGLDTNEEKSFQEKLSLKGLSLIRACIKMVFNPAQTFKYQKPQEKEERAAAMQAIKVELLSQAFVQELMEVVVTKFFVFREADLREWEEEPEEWEYSMETEGEGYDFSIRPCAEKVFLDIALNYRDIVIQPLLAVFHQVGCKSSCQTLRDALHVLTAPQHLRTRIS